MDIASLAGMLLGVVMFLFGVFSSGGASGLFNMFDFPSIIITLGGSISGTLASNKLQDFIAGLKSITLTFKEVPQDPAAVIRNIIDLSNTARKEGLLALVTTLYGSLIANWLCNPTASKLSVNNNNEMMMKEITVEGILSIQAGENPRVIEEKLKSFLSPSAREETAEGSVGGEE